jgi:hypothetical protein
VEPPPQPQTTATVCRFEPAPGNLGLDFVHTNGADGRKLLPETMGPGCVLFDADGDADLDLFITNGASWASLIDGARPTGRFYALENGRYVDRTGAAGLSVLTLAGIGQGAVAADYDGTQTWTSS